MALSSPRTGWDACRLTWMSCFLVKRVCWRGAGKGGCWHWVWLGLWFLFCMALSPGRLVSGQRWRDMSASWVPEPQASHGACVCSVYAETDSPTPPSLPLWKLAMLTSQSVLLGTPLC